MSATDRRGGDERLALVALVVGLAAAAVFVGAAHLGAHLDGGGVRLPWNPLALALALAGPDAVWPAHGWMALGLLLVPALLLAAVAGWSAVRAGKRRQRVDRAAKHMAGPRDVGHLTETGVAEQCRTLGVTFTGPRIGRLVPGRRRLVQGPEDVSVDIWGPRQGKSSRRTIVAVMGAVGAVVATSNRRDLLDGTRDPRAQLGEVWVFDPQGIAGEQPTWWWNPLSTIARSARPEVEAGKLARLWSDAAKEPGAKTDAYFDPAATNLLANYLLWAALLGRPLTDVYLRLTDPTNEEAADDLAGKGYRLQAAAVRGVTGAPEKQRGGVFGTALERVAFITSPSAARWVIADGSRRPEFDPAAFVAADRPGTLYLLSKEGEGSTGPIVLALTVAVADEAKRVADRSSGGRLARPITLVLDEAANICRWRELPSLYSHLGGSGIPVMTFLQSWSQGVGVWGELGMRALWSASTVTVLGSGVSEVGFLGDAAKLIGPYLRRTTSGSSSRGTASRSWSEREDQVLSVADLGGLPRGRAVLFGSGVRRPALIETVPWWHTEHQAAVQASFDRHDPAGLSRAVDEPEDTDVPAPGAAWAVRR